MKLDKAAKRDKRRHQRKNGMRRSGDSVKIIQNVLIKRGGKGGTGHKEEE